VGDLGRDCWLVEAMEIAGTPIEFAEDTVDSVFITSRAERKKVSCSVLLMRRGCPKARVTGAKECPQQTPEWQSRYANLAPPSVKDGYNVVDRHLGAIKGLEHMGKSCSVEVFCIGGGGGGGAARKRCS
jgi:hypothetical protein